MTVYTIALLFGALAVPALLGMWCAWRARARRDATVLADVPAPHGEVIECFARVGYVSTTPEGAPLERVALPGLRYKGDAEVTVRRDGVTIQVTGERPVHIAAERVLGTGDAGVRIGKAVERGGLCLLDWRADRAHAESEADGDSRTLESSFRFAESAEQRRFVEAIEQILSPVMCGAPEQIDTDGTTQEDA